MSKIKEIDLCLNKEKCKFSKSEVSYLVGSYGVKRHPEKVKAIAELDSPSNVSQLRTVLGMFNYLTKFIPDMATIPNPITQLLHTDTAWV